MAIKDKRWGLTGRVVIRDEQGRILFLRRSKTNRTFVGCWEWPGGKVDAGEDIAAAVVRETKEEIGLEVRITGFATAFHFELDAVHVVTICMEAQIIGGTLQLSDEHDAHAWLTAENLPAYPLTEPHKNAITAYVQLCRKDERSTPR